MSLSVKGTAINISLPYAKTRSQNLKFKCLEKMDNFFAPVFWHFFKKVHYFEVELTKCRDFLYHSVSDSEGDSNPQKL